MKIERSCATAAGVKKVRRGLRRIRYLLFLVTAGAAVGASASPFGDQGGSTSLTAMANLAEGARLRDNALPASIIVVTNTNDSGPGSLRQALADAYYGDTIDATGVSGTILLTSGELQILTDGVTVNGPGAGTLAVNGNGTSRVFENFALGYITISGFTITNGRSDGGGGIRDSAPHPNIGGYGLTVTNCTISGNAADYGGGIQGALTISNSTISGNSAMYGGGICNLGGGVWISNSTISGNLADVDGGGVYNSGALGEFVFSIIENSTIDGNSASGHGDGIYNSSSGLGQIRGLYLSNTILNAGGSGGTIFNVGRVASTYNLASDAGGGVLTGPGDQINTDPLLGPLQDNGGPTFTHALLPGSPAIDRGAPSFASPPYYDQRGAEFWRVRNARIDVGSFEVQIGTPPPRPRPTPHPRPTL
jgi:hypothetical protein